jgi:inhibitor of cysteine peptidase
MSERIEARAGSTFEIVLEAALTSGYRWTVDLAADASVEPAGEDVQPGAEVGGRARQVFRFRALRPGATTLTFKYQRPWEPAPKDSREYSVTIE